MRVVRVVALVLLGTTLLSAQASRTWVSGVGDDANPCSRTAPCKTFAGAISKTMAGGEIDALDPGGFGALTITKAITIDGGGGQVSSVLVSGTNALVVVAGAGDSVTLRNLSLNGIGTGINGVQFLSGQVLNIENCTISNFTNNGIDIEPSSGGRVNVVNTTSRGNNGSGLAVQAGSNAFVSIDHSRFESNVFGVFAGNFSRITVKDSVASGNSGVGFISAPTAGTAELNLVNSVAANNVGAGVQAGNGTTQATTRVSGVAVYDNGYGFAVGANGTILSFGNNYSSDPGSPNSNLSPR